MSVTRSINLGKHDEKLQRLAKATGRNFTETLRLALDALEEKEARREKEVKGI